MTPTAKSGPSSMSYSVSSGTLTETEHVISARLRETRPDPIRAVPGPTAFAGAPGSKAAVTALVAARQPNRGRRATKTPAHPPSARHSGSDAVDAVAVDQEALPGLDHRASHPGLERQASISSDGYLLAVTERRGIRLLAPALPRNSADLQPSGQHSLQPFAEATGGLARHTAAVVARLPPS